MFRHGERKITKFLCFNIKIARCNERTGRLDVDDVIRFSQIYIYKNVRENEKKN